MNVTLRQLVYFDALAHESHFGRAASRVAVSQPAISAQIRELETELGVKLVERLPGGARLTETGKQVAERAARVIAEVSDLTDLARVHQEALTGTLTLGVIPSVAPYLLPPLLPLVRERYPNIHLRVRESRTERIVAELREGKLDLLLAALPIEGADLHTHQLFDDPFLLAAPDSFRIKGNVSLGPDLLRDEQMLLLEEGHCFRDQALAYCALRKVRDIDTFGASTLATIVQMVANGMGVTLLPEMAVPVEARNPNISLHRLRAPEPSRTIGLAWRRSSPREADFAALGSLILQARGSLEIDKPGTVRTRGAE